MVVAMSEKGVIGQDEHLPWKLSSDLRRFKSLTMGQCLLMGRKTFQSIGRPLPGRQTIVLSRSGWSNPYPQVCLATDLAQVDALVQPGRRVMVVGGAEVYRAALSRCQQLWMTRVLAEVGGDTYFPNIDWTQWQLVSSQFLPAGPADQWPTEFQQWQRITPGTL
ncbi:MAG: dihydrofolate reductase [Pirellulaceae bacterium]|nr:dihydrofolate reductase [Pirellulaceae bacterium]